jgi:polysaccharide pyruvyl transferase WcaK-like protein
MSDSIETLRVGLLTPYSGCNLGDGAIQDAVKWNIKKRCPHAEFVLLTADPKNTQAIHGVPSFPLTGIYIPGYSMTILRSNTERPWPSAPATAGLKGAIKGNSFTNVVLGGPFRVTRRAFRAVRLAGSEARHIVRSLVLTRRLDLVIASGGGQIDDYFGGAMAHPYTMAKWGVVARIARAKYVLMSVGVGQLESWLSRRFANIIVRAASFRTFRDPGSKRLVELNNAVRNDKIYSDLAFSYPAKEIVEGRRRREPGDSLVVGVCPIAYLSDHEWPERDARAFEAYFRVMLELIRWLVAHNHRVALFTTDIPDEAIGERLLSESSLDEAQRRRVDVKRYANPAELIGGLASFDVVIASRLHAIILSHVIGVPALAISYERKVATHMHEMGHDAFCLDYHGISLEPIRLLFERIVAERAALSADLLAQADARRRQLDEQYEALLAFARANARRR